MLCLPVNPGYRKLETKEYIKVRSCYTVTAGEEMIYSRRFLEYCEMIYVTGGQIHIAAAGTEYTVSAGELLVIPCYQIVDGVRHSDVKASFYTVEFSCSDGLIENIAGRVVSIQEDGYFIGKMFQRLSASLDNYGNEDNYEGDALCV